MSDWGFDDANPIANFTVALELFTQIDPAALQDIASKHPLFKRDLPRRQEQPLLMFPMPGSPIIPQQVQIAGVVFDNVNNDGSIAKSLTIAPHQISYMSANYSRWKEFQPVFERLFGEIIKIVSSPLRISAISLAATNRFRWRGDESKSGLKSLLNSGSRLFAPHVLETNEHCHSFHGYLEKRVAEPVGHYIRNINVQTGQQLGDGKIATILLSHRLFFDAPASVPPDFFDGSTSTFALGSRLTSEMHFSNNKLFADVISREISDKMPGLFL
jgi:uncharacterized protein (TIGR04255 family)